MQWFTRWYHIPGTGIEWYCIPIHIWIVPYSSVYNVHFFHCFPSLFWGCAVYIITKFPAFFSDLLLRKPSTFWLWLYFFLKLLLCNKMFDWSFSDAMYVLFHLFLYISQCLQSHVCVYSVFWSTVYLNNRVSNMGITHVKWVILGILITSSTPLYQHHRNDGNIRSDEPGPHIDAVSQRNQLYWIRFSWTIIGEVCTITFCTFVLHVHSSSLLM